MSSVLRSQLLSDFTCLGDRCEDTCCQGWSMQMDDATLARYRKEAPELSKAVEETPEGWIMRKDAASGFCVKLESGLCGIHKTHGAAFLGDACYFYPRVTRALGDKTIMTATLSCPEITRLVLKNDNAFALEEAQADRLPQTLKNYLPDAVTSDEALAVHTLFLKEAADKNRSAEMNFLRIASVSRSLEKQDIKSWPQAAEFYFKHVDSRLPPAETNVNDPFNLLHALCGLIVAAHKPPVPRMRQLIGDIEKALAVTLDWKNVQIHTSDQSLSAYEQLQALWQKENVHYEPALRRWLEMQMSMALYPYSGLGAKLSERITIIGVRLATLKLGLICSSKGVVSEETVVRVIQTLSRFLDHLGDPGFSLQIYSETSWIQEKRMRGLLEG